MNTTGIKNTGRKNRRRMGFDIFPEKTVKCGYNDEDKNIKISYRC